MANPYLPEIDQTENGADLTWVINLGGDAVCFNDQALTYLGLGPEEAAGWRWQWAVHPADLAQVRRAWSSAMRSGASFDARFRLRGLDGVYRWFLFAAIPFEGDADTSGWFARCHPLRQPSLAEIPELELALV